MEGSRVLSFVGKGFEMLTMPLECFNSCVCLSGNARCWERVRTFHLPNETVEIGSKTRARDSTLETEEKASDNTHTHTKKNIISCTSGTQIINFLISVLLFKFSQLARFCDLHLLHVTKSGWKIPLDEEVFCSASGGHSVSSNSH